MPTIVCPHCKFEITVVLAGQSALKTCSNCSKKFDTTRASSNPDVVPPPTTMPPPVAPPAPASGQVQPPPHAPVVPIASVETEPDPAESSEAISEAKAAESRAMAEENRRRAERLLPPKFEAKDPARLSLTRTLGGEVLVPDGSGGVESVDASWVNISHRGKVYRLRRSPTYGFYLSLVVNTLLVIVAIVLLVAIVKVAAG